MATPGKSEHEGAERCPKCGYEIPWTDKLDLLVHDAITRKLSIQELHAIVADHYNLTKTLRPE